MTDLVNTGPMLARREVAQLVLALSAGIACAPFDVAKAADGDPSFKTGGEELLAFMKLQSRADDGYTNYVNTGTVYAAVPGRQSIPLFNYEGLLRFYTKVVGANLYDVTFIEAGDYRDLKTGDRLEHFQNPLTGMTNTVSPVVEGPMTWRWTTDTLHVENPAPILRRRVAWQHFDGQSWLQFDNMISMGAPGGQVRHAAAFATYVGRTAEMEDNSRSSVSDTMLIDTSINPWADWLAMGDRPGRLANNIIGRKLGTISEAPDRLIRIIAATHPKVLKDVEAWQAPQA